MSEDRHAELFATAVTEFAARGIGDARLEVIARGAGVGVPEVLREFGDKDGLLRGAVRAVAAEHVARTCAPLPPGSAVEQLRNFCGRCWDVLHTPAHAALHRLWVTDLVRYPDLARFYGDEVYAAIHRMLSGTIERGIAEGVFRPVPPAAAARVIMAAMGQQAFWCSHADAFGPGLREDCHRAVADTLNVMLGGLRAPAPDSTS
jgi:AcrR family transcriptional regulator